jgi:hypothetical protein
VEAATTTRNGSHLVWVIRSGWGPEIGQSWDRERREVEVSSNYLGYSVFALLGICLKHKNTGNKIAEVNIAANHWAKPIRKVTIRWPSGIDLSRLR